MHYILEADILLTAGQFDDLDHAGLEKLGSSPFLRRYHDQAH